MLFSVVNPIAPIRPIITMLKGRVLFAKVEGERNVLWIRRSGSCFVSQKKSLRSASEYGNRGLSALVLPMMISRITTT